MSDLTAEYDTTEPNEPAGQASVADDQEAPEKVTRKVSDVIATIKADKQFHDKAFKRMKKSMFMAFWGRDETWAEANYKANFAGRHVKQKTASLYAKNPKATAKRAERLDFTLWDENPQSLMMAFQITQAAQQALAVAQQQTAAMPPDPITGIQVPVQPVLPPGFQEAQALIADFEAGTKYRQTIDKIGRTLEILFAKALRDQEPLDFKVAAKALVRRACTCGVGYIEMNFIREYGPRPDIDSELADASARLDHLRRLATEAAEGDLEDDSAEMAELEMGIAALQAEPEIVLREGLIFDFPAATKVIPDSLTKQLVGFVGARHLTVEYLFTCEQLEELFPDADIKKGYKGYGADGSVLDGQSGEQIPFDFDGEDGEAPTRMDGKGKGLVCVWKHYDKMSGLVYYVADGHKEFLREPAAPDVFVENFWPVFALTFNAVENEKELFPMSDVELLWDQQMEHNRSRQGMREHRQAARPRFAVSKGLIDDEGKDTLKTAKAFDVIELNKDGSTKLNDIIEAIPVPGVDPNLYETGQFSADTQLVVGEQSAQLGAVSKATATETAIAANSTLSSDDSSKDDLDDFLSAIARAGSQILFREMSEEQVKQIVGPGAVWPQQTLAQIANEIYLEVEAGSTGRSNQAVDIDNFQKLAPLILQIPGIDKVELAKEAIRRLDDRLDVNKFILPSAPSIIAENAMTQAATPPPSNLPSEQGGQGGNNAPRPPGQPGEGTGPAFGSNQTGRPTL